MNKNNGLGTIPISTPILKRMNRAIMGVYRELTAEELKALGDEIKSVTETNCSSRIYDIANMLADDVNMAVKLI